MELHEKIKNFRQSFNEPGQAGYFKSQFMAQAETLLRDSSLPPLASVLGLSPAEIGATVHLTASDAELTSIFGAQEEAGEVELSFNSNAKLVLRILDEEVELTLEDLIPLAQVGGVKSRRFWHPKPELEAIVDELRASGKFQSSAPIVNAVHDGRLRKGDFTARVVVTLSFPERTGRVRESS